MGINEVVNQLVTITRLESAEAANAWLSKAIYREGLTQYEINMAVDLANKQLGVHRDEPVPY